MGYNVTVYGKHIRLNFIMTRRETAGEYSSGAVVVPKFDERGSANEENYYITAYVRYGTVTGGDSGRD